MNKKHSYENDLKRIREFSLTYDIPIISPQVKEFLRGLIFLSRPRLILEIGTGAGYSTLVLQKEAPEKCEIVTIEKNIDRGEAAREFFKAAGVDSSINLKLDDAREVLPHLRRQFDFVFIDGAKGQYPRYLKECKPLLTSGSIIVADNILYHGLVQKRGKVPHSHRTLVKRLREYLRLLEEIENLETRIFKIGDGLAVSKYRV